MTKQFLTELTRIEDKQNNLEREKVDLLLGAGWRRSSAFPGALSLWSKTFPESTVQWEWKGKEKAPHPGFTINGATTGTALHIEAAWQAYWI